MMLLSLECNGCKATVTSDPNLLPTVQRKKETAATDGRRVENGERNGRVCPPSKNYCKKIGMANTKMKNKMASHSDSSEFCCTSSVGSCGAAAGFFGGGDDKEAAAILSSASFSSDSAEYYSHPCSSTTRIKNKHKNTPNKRRGARACNAKRNVRHVEKEEVVAVDVERGVAVERLSTDLYGDFRRSMVEMIMSRRKLRAGDMDCLLRCYLSLNSPEHHLVIIKAFSDVYKGIFSPSPY